MAELNWGLPDKDSTYNNTIIYYSTAKFGTYSTLATVTNIRTQKYTDNANGAGTWYKIRWHDTVNNVYSAYSQPFKATGVISDTNYTTPKFVCQYLGNYREVVAEVVGTGNAVLTEFTLDDPKVIADTETVYINAVAQRRNLDYTIDYETAKITFSSAPGAFAITADYWATSDVQNSQIVNAIRRAEDTINRFTGQTFYQPQDTTETIDSYDPLDTYPFAYEATNYQTNIGQFRSNTSEFLTSRQIQLSHFPITAINQVLLNEQPTVVTGEAVGTGAGVVLVFPLTNSPVVYGSEIIYVAGVQVTNYTLDYSTGIITFNAAPTGAITADYTSCPAATVLATTDYFVRYDTGTIVLRNTTAQVKKMPMIVSVSYTYGYYDLPPVVQDLATRQAALSIMQSSYMGAKQPQAVAASNMGMLLGEIRSLYDMLGRKFTVVKI
jgi:hypothetical protein